MYEVVFDGVKLDSAEGQFFEWQVRCAKNDNASLGGQIETAIQRLKQLSSLHTTVCEIERHLSRIEPLAAQFHNWPQLSPTANKEDKRVLTMAGLFGLIERSKTKFLEESKQLKELPGPPIQIPTITFISTIPATGVISIDNTTIQARYTLGGKQDEDADERLRSSISSARFALQILLIERDSAQRRADRLMTETSRLQEVLRTEGERRRAMRRTIFERTLREIRQHPVTTNANAIGTVSVPSFIGMPNLGIVSSQEGSGMHAHAVSAYFSTESTVTDDLPLPPAYSKRITNARTTS
ncbi:hypothetical protein BKA62DRAFT_18611 [Auriculariales sp. MPI-PUGE-AT-0066]|nr:hypothetical protein BKA62DRAFT_18611 [Auriculariales sp. MPI-PUGE-AT-0066]